MKHTLTITFILIGLFVSAQMLDESVLKNNVIRYHKSYINIGSLGFSLPNAAIRKNFGSGVGWNMGFTYFVVKNRKLGGGICIQASINSIKDGVNRSVLIGPIIGYKINRSTNIEGKFLIGGGIFNPPDDGMLRKLGYNNQDRNVSKGLRSLIGFNIRQRLSKRMCLLAGLDRSSGEFSLIVHEAYIDFNDPSASGSHNKVTIFGPLKFTTIYLGFAVLLK